MTPKISDSEWEVMNAIWVGEPMTAVQVFEALPAGHGWKQKTVSTFLTRLVGKRILKAEKQGRALSYSSLLSRSACVREEGKSFLNRVFKGAAGDLVLHFCGQADLDAAEIRELEALLKQKKPRA